MRRVLGVALVAVAVAACSHKPPPAITPAPRQTFEFTAESSPDSVRLRVTGNATIDSGWIRVQVVETQVTLPAGRAENWRGLTVRSMLATDYRRGWTSVAQARQVNVFRFLDFSKSPSEGPRSLKVEQPLSFMVPIPPGAVLADARLAFELEWVFIYSGYGETESRVAFSGPIVPVTVPR